MKRFALRVNEQNDTLVIDAEGVLLELEEGEVVLTKAEVEALSQEIKHVYFSNAEAKVAVKKICYAASKQS